ncbi:Nramp-domain-containing protein [Rhizoclosmatium globosum]|uniref:Nramp-domain-containing protein n=1 Tax=Rhizoclosmatium globosum TaxID=329046 RepID=A0A1Y2CVT6_9FUNG|nr:Nramp-domain-containing protein [Rhizoclosmatium globosum]|eukprot:ORY51006.1 Nramp-domain-containing protein [Rhizoclosmatium globosum]
MTLLEPERSSTSLDASDETHLLPRCESVEIIEDEGRFRMADFLRFVGPGFMIGVGYLDPGNWATDLAAGSQFGYTLLYIILLANVMAIVLQYLCIKLGVVTGNDLAMACRKHFSYRANIALYILTQLAIIATDIAEVIGTAIALNLIFNLPLPYGVALTSLDVLFILAFYGAEHLRKYEFIVIALLGIVSACFIYLLVVSGPVWEDVVLGYLPSIGIFTDSNQLYIAMGIMGATIMPHNLYLHFSIVRFRSHKDSGSLGEIVELPEQQADLNVENVQPKSRIQMIPDSLRYSNMDSIMALCGALLINSSILIVAAASFYLSGETEVAEIKDAFLLLRKHLGPPAAYAFAIALFCAGQSSTITGTLAGQIVTEGFLGPSIQFRPALQRLFTRILAIAPALASSLLTGENGMNQLLVLSQVVLSLQLPFAIWPLIWITCGGGDGEAMKVKFRDTGTVEDGTGEVVEDETVIDFRNGVVLKVFAVVIAVFITIFNVILLWGLLF